MSGDCDSTVETRRWDRLERERLQASNALERQAAREVNAARLETDLEPFGTLPSRVACHVSAVPPVLGDPTDIDAA